MKKVIAVLLVLCVAASLFAAVTVKAGFDFSAGSTKTLEDKGSGIKDVTLKTHGVGFDIAVIGDVAPNLAVYGDVTAAFPIFFKSNFDGGSTEYTVIKADVADVPAIDGTTYKFPGLKISNVSLRAGVLYKMKYQGLDLGFGGGLVYSLSKYKAGDKDFNKYQRGVSNNFGLSLYATGTYNVAKNVGVNLTINPDVFLYNYTATYYKGLYSAPTDKEVCGFEAYGMRLGFAFNASLGVAFSF